MAKKKKSSIKMPYNGDYVTIYGIIDLSTQKLIKVDLNEDDIWFEFDMSMYDPTKYSVVKLQVLLT